MLPHSFGAFDRGVLSECLSISCMCVNIFSWHAVENITNILAKSSNRPLTFSGFTSPPLPAPPPPSNNLTVLFISPNRQMCHKN